jgi:hypothetical protein
MKLQRKWNKIQELIREVRDLGAVLHRNTTKYIQFLLFLTIFLMKQGNFRNVAVFKICDGGQSRLQWPRCLRLEHWDRGFESHSKHGCMCAFILFVLSSTGSGLVTDWSPVQEVLPTVCRLRNWTSGPGPTKDRRAMQRDDGQTPVRSILYRETMASF